jgi:RHS repeat-associated protein
VFFDNLQVTHIRGPLLEENSFYPFGLSMSGISSKALNFGKENKKNKFNNAELNTDLDLNTYEFFYRNYDQQIGRWWQIDPKPSEMVSLYSSMNNNPISNYDPLGDTSIYYTSDGRYWFTSYDKLENSVVVITKDNEDAFFQHFYDTYALIPDDKRDVNAMNTDLRTYGASYSTEEYFAYYDQNSKDAYKGKDWDNGTKDIFKPIDDKGKLINEHAGSTELKNGYVRITPGTDDPGNPTTSSPKAGQLGVHTHTNEGRRIDVIQRDGSYRSGTVQSGRAGLGVDVGSTTFTDASKGNFRVVVTPTHMYLYANGQVTIAVDRKLTPSKNPGEIK